MRGFHAARTDGRVPSAADTGAVDRAILTDPATALRKVAQMTEGFSGSDLTQVCREAARGERGRSCCRPARPTAPSFHLSARR